MVRNTRGGNKHKKQASSNTVKNNKIKYKDDKEWKDFDYGQILYGKVIRRLGGSPPYILVLCEDKKERKCVVRGKFNKKIWMQPEDIVLITYDIDSTDKDSKGEILHKYQPQDMDTLKKNGGFNPNHLKTKEELEDDLSSDIVFKNEDFDDGDDKDINNLQDLDENEIDLNEI